jgi:hypothetical protein
MKEIKLINKKIEEAEEIQADQVIKSAESFINTVRLLVRK